MPPRFSSTTSSGAPFTPTVGDISGLGTGGQRPNLAPWADLATAVKGGIDQYFDPTLFVMPAPASSAALLASSP